MTDSPADPRESLLPPDIPAEFIPHRVVIGANLLEIKEPPRPVKKPEKLNPGKKQRLLGFSPKARYNLAKTLSRLEWPIPPAHVTLTYHLTWPEDPKGDLAALRKWCERRGFAGVWRLEFQNRRKPIPGLVPHFHLLLSPFDPEQEMDLRKWWAQRTGNASPYAVHITFREAGRASWYLALHHSKGTQAPKIKVGRWWGFINRKTVLDFEHREEIGHLNRKQYAVICRIARRLTRKRLRLRKGQSFSLFLSDFWQRRLLLYLEKEYGELRDPF